MAQLRRSAKESITIASIKHQIIPRISAQTIMLLDWDVHTTQSHDMCAYGDDAPCMGLFIIRNRLFQPRKAVRNRSPITFKIKQCRESTETPDLATNSSKNRIEFISGFRIHSKWSKTFSAALRRIQKLSFLFAEPFIRIGTLVHMMNRPLFTIHCITHVCPVVYDVAV